MVWLEDPRGAYAWSLPFTQIGYGSLVSMLVLTFGWSAIFLLGEMWAILLYGVSAPESSVRRT